MTRAYFRDNAVEGSWCPHKKQRTSEYDALYWWLKKHAVELTALEGRPFTVLEAAERVQAAKEIGGSGQKGKMTLPQFVTFCCKARTVDRAAAAAAEGAVDEEDVDGVPSS